MFTLLNDRELSESKGGTTVLKRLPGFKIVLCETWEIHCDAEFKFSDGNMNCPNAFSIIISK